MVVEYPPLARSLVSGQRGLDDYTVRLISLRGSELEVELERTRAKLGPSGCSSIAFAFYMLGFYTVRLDFESSPDAKKFPFSV